MNVQAKTDTTVKINEIFYSLQGETTTVGLPTVFVRLTGCPLRCSYCDTDYAFYDGERMSIADVVAKVATYKPRFVTVTGGEPLAQKGCFPLLQQLCDQEFRVSLETGGALPIEEVDWRVAVILDLKTPGSGEMTRNRYENIRHLKPGDEVKFVICNRRDYDWAKLRMDDLRLTSKVNSILFSPSFDVLSPADLAQWIIEDNLPVRMQLQMHKQIWGDVPGR